MQSRFSLSMCSTAEYFIFPLFRIAYSVSITVMDVYWPMIFVVVVVVACSYTYCVIPYLILYIMFGGAGAIFLKSFFLLLLLLLCVSALRFEPGPCGLL